MTIELEKFLTENLLNYKTTEDDSIFLIDGKKYLEVRQKERLIDSGFELERLRKINRFLLLFLGHRVLFYR